MIYQRLASSPGFSSFSVLHAEKKESLGDKITMNTITAYYLMNMGKINH